MNFFVFLVFVLSPILAFTTSISHIRHPRPIASHFRGPELRISPAQTPRPCTSPTSRPGKEDLKLCRSNLTGNPIDDCWRYDRHWAKNRQDLAKCSIGFGRKAKGGFNGSIYVVTDPRDDRHNPQVGTLRYGAMQDRPLWIVFARDMSIKLEYQLQINSFKTIDGRGANVTISSSVSTCLDMTNVTDVIIHGLRVHDCSEDGITVTNSSHIWIDHCSLSRCGDGLLDVVHGSTMVTISNNYLTHHNKVMLLGNSDKNVDDKKMRVTVAFNHFGEGLNQRLPRCRFGVFHIVNNHYTHWLTYAIGGSSAPTIYSQGNRFLNSDVLACKTVTKHMNATEEEWMTWNWRSEGDLLLNGTHFDESGNESIAKYQNAGSVPALHASLVPLLTRDAGVLLCKVGKCC